MGGCESVAAATLREAEKENGEMNGRQTVVTRDPDDLRRIDPELQLLTV